MKYESQFRKYFRDVGIFTFRDARRFLKMMGASDAYAKLFVYNQVKAHGLLRVGKGYYTFVNNDALAGFAFSPFYYGLEYALTLHKLWTQMANPVIITTTSAVPGVRDSMGSRVIVRRISKKMFFGIERIKYNDIFIPVSDVEKTLVDFIYYRIGLNKEDTAAILKACDKRKLRRYASRSGKRTSISLSNIFAGIKK